MKMIVDSFEYPELKDDVRFFWFNRKYSIKIASLSWNWYLDYFEYATFNDDPPFLCFRLEILFLGKFVSKIQYSQFNTLTILNMQNFRLEITFFSKFGSKY